MAPRRSKVKPEPLVPDPEVWQEIARGVKPIRRSNIAPQPLAPLPKLYRPEGAGAAAYAKIDAKEKRPLLPAHVSPGRHGEPPELQMDKRLKQRFQRGELPVEARLDLHGLTLANAERALSKLIRDSLAQQKRCLLVITGKGARSASENDLSSGTMSGRGVLRAWLPDYLKRGPWRGQILGVTPARPHMGGTGAFYVLLRRQRNDGR